MWLLFVTLLSDFYHPWARDLPGKTLDLNHIGVLETPGLAIQLEGLNGVMATINSGNIENIERHQGQNVHVDGFRSSFEKQNEGCICAKRVQVNSKTAREQNRYYIKQGRNVHSHFLVFITLAALWSA